MKDQKYHVGWKLCYLLSLLCFILMFVVSQHFILGLAAMVVHPLLLATYFLHKLEATILRRLSQTRIWNAPFRNLGGLVFGLLFLTIMFIQAYLLHLFA